MTLTGEAPEEALPHGPLTPPPLSFATLLSPFAQNTLLRFSTPFKAPLVTALPQKVSLYPVVTQTQAVFPALTSGVLQQ